MIRTAATAAATATGKPRASGDDPTCCDIDIGPNG